jgi:choline dehydrogenase-like flavoprotein
MVPGSTIRVGGIRHNPDYSGTSQEGIAMSQATIAGGRRMSTARCYLDPVRNRRNLHIETEALTEGLVARREALRRRPLFLRRRGARSSRGARGRGQRRRIQPAQLLELSGIGQTERLRKLGIEVRRELPGVGENLRDHYVPRTR